MAVRRRLISKPRPKEWTGKTASSLTDAREKVLNAKPQNAPIRKRKLKGGV